MNIKELIQFFRDKPGYLKKGAYKTADRTNSTVDNVKEAKRLYRLGIHPNIADEMSSMSTDFPEGYMTEYKNAMTQFNSDHPQVPEGMKVKSVWNTLTKDGVKLMYSYEKVGELEQVISVEDWKDILQNIRPLKVKKTKPSNNNKSLIVWTSDKHIGSHIPDTASFKATYNEGVFVSRMSKILEEVMSQYRLHGKFDKLILADLGDSLDGLDGMTTRGGHKLPQNLSNKESASVHFRVHEWYYKTLISANIADEVIIYNVTNCNHSGDFGWQACFALKQYASVAWPEVKFINQEQFIDHYELYDRAYIITHGKDKSNRSRGFPLKLTPKDENHLLDYARQHSLINKDLHVRKGDLHMDDLDNSSNHLTYWNIGSVFGASDWIMDNYGSSTPTCVFEIVEKGVRDTSGKVKHLQTNKV